MVSALLRRILGSALGRDAVPECALRAVEGSILLEVLDKTACFCQFKMSLKTRIDVAVAVADCGASLAMMMMMIMTTMIMMIMVVGVVSITFPRRNMCYCGLTRIAYAVNLDVRQPSYMCINIPWQLF